MAPYTRLWGHVRPRSAFPTGVYMVSAPPPFPSLRFPNRHGPPLLRPQRDSRAESIESVSEGRGAALSFERRLEAARASPACGRSASPATSVSSGRTSPSHSVSSQADRTSATSTSTSLLHTGPRSVDPSQAERPRSMVSSSGHSGRRASLLNMWRIAEPAPRGASRGTEASFEHEALEAAIAAVAAESAYSENGGRTGSAAVDDEGIRDGRAAADSLPLLSATELQAANAGLREQVARSEAAAAKAEEVRKLRDCLEELTTRHAALELRVAAMAAQKRQAQLVVTGCAVTAAIAAVAGAGLLLLRSPRR